MRIFGWVVVCSLVACSSSSSEPSNGGSSSSTSSGGGSSSGSTAASADGGATTFACPDKNGAASTCKLSSEYCLVSKATNTSTGEVTVKGYCVALPAGCTGCSCAEADQPKSAGYIDCAHETESCKATSAGDITITCEL